MTTTNRAVAPRRALQAAALVPLALALAFGLAGCDEKKAANGAAQAAAKVNKDEITLQQIGYQLQLQRGLKPEQADAASKQILERLIEQELAVQKGTELKLDQDPRVVQQLDAARREVIARAYLEKTGDSAAKPSPQEIAKYYDDKPALFKERRVYSIQEIAIEAKPEQLPELKSSLEGAKNIGEFVEYLKSHDYRFAGNQAVRAAEQLPLASLDTFAKMKDGQALLNASANGAQVIVLAGSRSQPVMLEQATPAIEQFLLNERKREILAKDMKVLRDAAKIEYLGKFAPAASASAPGAAAPASGASAGG